MKHWLFRHAFLILAIVLSEIMVLVFLITRPYQRVKSEVLGTWVQDQPILGQSGTAQPQACPAPFYDATGQMRLPDQPYQGPAPVYQITWPDCNYPASLPVDQLTSSGISFYALHMRSSELNEWVKSGESFSLWAEFSLDDRFEGQQALSREAITWKADESQPVHIWLDAPNFEFSPANGDTGPQTLSIGGSVRQSWVLAPKERASGQQIISITLLELQTAPGRVDLTTRIALQILPILNIGPMTLVLVPLALVLGWALDHLKTALEIQTMLMRRKKKPAETQPSPAEPQLPEKTIRQENDHDRL